MRGICSFVTAVVLFWSSASIVSGRDPEPGQGIADRVERLERELDRERRAAAVDRGARIFARACAACHGRDGRGDGPGAADLDPAPRDLTSRQIRFRSSASGAPPRPEDLERTIRDGLPGTAMPAFGRLFSEREMSALVGYIYSLRPDTEATATPADPLPLPAIDPPTPGALEEGRALYLLAGCWRCHGVDGAGRGPSAPFLTDENERPIRVLDFRHDPYKGGRDARAVVRALLTGLNGSPMPAYGEGLLITGEGGGGDLPPDDQLLISDGEAVDRFLRSSPAASALEAMTSAERTDLRDRRLVALAHYVLSLGRRRGAGYWLFREEPEREARSP